MEMERHDSAAPLRPVCPKSAPPPALTIACRFGTIIAALDPVHSDRDKWSRADAVETDVLLRVLCLGWIAYRVDTGFQIFS
mmetsp:Transcript_34651/g.72666  ORF Transcript_34651/g.72666 Transcript_34651/m.72666 type:complete len:81 (+) Transcript_34651:302-544(+)